MRLFGHPVHPLLVAFPIGLLALMPLWDVLSWLGWPAQAASVAYVCEAAGLIAASLAIVSGFAELIRLTDERVVRIALYHATAAMTSVCLFGLALALRGHAARVSLPVSALDAAGSLTLAVAGWFGGHLVFHYRVAVEETAAPQKLKSS